jgi:hypothetical protein
MAVCAAALAACSSGGGGSPVNTGGNAGGTPGGNTGGTTSPDAVLGTPVTPNYGMTPGPLVMATTKEATPTFTGTSLTGFATGKFPALQSALTSSTGTIGGASTIDTATLTIDNTGPTDCAFSQSCTTQFKLYLPTAHLTVSGTIPGTLAGGSSTTFNLDSSKAMQLRTAGLDYMTFGTWALVPTAQSLPTDAGSFVTGYVTPTASVPTTGQAQYSSAGGTGRVFVVNAGKVISASLSGFGVLDVDFGTGAVTGAIKNITTTPDDTPNALPSLGGVHDILITANIVRGEPNISGTTSSTKSNISNQFTLKDTATGKISGQFFGPNATEIGAVWTLSNGDGTGFAVGAFASVKSSATGP